MICHIDAIDEAVAKVPLLAAFVPLALDQKPRRTIRPLDFVERAAGVDVGRGRRVCRISTEVGSSVLESEQSLLSPTKAVQGDAEFKGGIAVEPERQGFSGLQGGVARYVGCNKHSCTEP